MKASCNQGNKTDAKSLGASQQLNMADFMEDVGVGYYRSLDPPKNFVVK